MVCLYSCFCVAIPTAHDKLLKKEKLNTDSVSLPWHFLHPRKHYVSKVAYFCERCIKTEHFRTPFDITVGVMPLTTFLFS